MDWDYKLETLEIIKEKVNNIKSAKKDLKRIKMSLENLIFMVLVKLKKKLCFSDMNILFDMNEN